MKQKTKKWKRLRLVILLLLFMLTIGVFIANKFAKRYGYSSVFEVVSLYNSQSKLAESAEIIELEIDISASDYQFIKQKREIALNRGLQINEGENYVPCKLAIAGETTNGVIRLKGHMTDHLQGNKWSYRIKSDEPVMGMNRFSIQHPGTRNYVYEWIYHQLLKEEGVIYLDYNFINVKLNGESLGIYAVEEHFGQHVLAHNDRPKGAILRWNPNLYWEWRIDEFQGVYLDEAYSHYTSSFAEPYDKGMVKKDPELIKNYQTAAYLLEQFRRGKKSTSEVFDVEKMARFHVIIDLVGGYHSLDWSDVKFYYNSDTKLVEPVGYESFSIRKTERIAGQRIPKDYSEADFNYHNQLFADPIFFAAYIQNLERIVDESYLNSFFKSIDKGLQEKIALIAKEWAYRKFSLEGYYENVRLIRNNISLPKPFHAFLKESNDGKLNISIAPVSDFPIQIIGLKRKGKIKDLDSVINLGPKPRHTFTHYFDYSINNPFKKSTSISVLAKIPGGSTVFEIELNEYPPYKSEVIKQDGDKINNFYVDTTILTLNENRELHFKAKKIVISKNILIPQSYKLTVYPGQELVFQNGTTLTIKGQLDLIGYDDQVVKVKADKTSNIVVNQGVLNATHVLFSDAIAIQSSNSQMTFKQCKLFDMKTRFIEDYQSSISLYNCYAGNINQLGLFNESILKIEGSNFKNGEVLLESNGSLISFFDSKIQDFKTVSELDYASQMGTWRTIFEDNDTISSLEKSSAFQTYNTSIVNTDLVFLMKNYAAFAGNCHFKLYKTKTKEIKQLEKTI